MGNEKYGEQNQQPNLLAPGLSNKKKNNQGCTEKLTVKGVVSDDEQSRGRKRGSLVLLGYLRRIEETSEHFQKLKEKKKLPVVLEELSQLTQSHWKGGISTDQVHVIVMAP
jgi:hypothetical protein